jgi:hypothetical protein
MPLLLKTTTQTGRLYRQIVSTSMPEKPKAQSPSTARPLAGLDRRRDGIAHADAHDDPSADIERLRG